MNVKHQFKVHHFCNGAVLAFVCLLFVMVLVFSGLVSAFSDVSLFVSGAPNKVVVSNEVGLRNAVNNAKGSTVIALDKDIQLTSCLNIPAKKDITLTSNTAKEFCKLINMVDGSAIFVEAAGVLRLDGIILAYDEGDWGGVWGGGVCVTLDGTFIMMDGKICSRIGGVNNAGTFELQGGIISGCITNGGVYNYGTFTMSGGEISDNRGDHGGGVHVGPSGSFSMSGGSISGNTADYSGGGVYVDGGSFSMSSGNIVNNTANVNGGGVLVVPGGSFSMSGGSISGNTAEGIGGGVFNSGAFNRMGGVVSGNTASNATGDVYTYGNNVDVSVEDSFEGKGDFSTGNESLPDGAGFSLWEVVVICAGVGVIEVSVGMAIIFLYVKKRRVPVE